MKLWKKIGLWAIGLGAFFSGCSSFYVINQTEQAVITRFGNPVRVIMNPLENEGTKQTILKAEEDYEKREGITVSKGAGLYFKIPFIDSVKRFERRLLRWDGYPEQIPTKDKKYLHVDTTVRWNIEDPLKFYRTVGTEEQAHARLDDVVDAATRNELTSRDLIEIVRDSNRKMQVTEKELEETVQVEKISEGREKIMQEICEKAGKTCEQYGMGIPPGFGYLVKGLTYVDSVKEKVEDRMISERTRIGEKYKSEGEGEFEKIMGKKELEQKRIMSEAYRTAKSFMGEGEATRVRIFAEALSRNPDFYNFIRSLEVYEKSFGKDTKILLGTDNELLQYLKGSGVINQKKPAEAP